MWNDTTFLISAATTTKDVLSHFPTHLGGCQGCAEYISRVTDSWMHGNSFTMVEFNKRYRGEYNLFV